MMETPQECRFVCPECDMEVCVKNDLQASAQRLLAGKDDLMSVILQIDQLIAKGDALREAVDMTKSLLLGCSNQDLLRVVHQLVLTKITDKMNSLDNDNQRNDVLTLIGDILARVWSDDLKEFCRKFLPKVLQYLSVAALQSQAARVLGYVVMNSAELKQEIIRLSVVNAIIDMLPLKDQYTLTSVIRLIAVISGNPKHYELMMQDMINTSDFFEALLYMLDGNFYVYQVGKTPAVLGKLVNLWQRQSVARNVNSCLAICAILDQFLKYCSGSDVNLDQILPVIPSILDLMDQVGDASPERALHLIITLAGCGNNVLSELLKNNIWEKLLGCPKHNDEAVRLTCNVVSAILEHGTHLSGTVTPPPSDVLDWVRQLLDTGLHNAQVRQAACSILIKVHENTAEKLCSGVTMAIAEMLADTDDTEEIRRLLTQLTYCMSAAPHEDLLKLCIDMLWNSCAWKLLRLVSHPDEGIAHSAQTHFKDVVWCLSQEQNR